MTYPRQIGNMKFESNLRLREALDTATTVENLNNRWVHVYSGDSVISLNLPPIVGWGWNTRKAEKIDAVCNWIENDSRFDLVKTVDDMTAAELKEHIISQTLAYHEGCNTGKRQFLRSLGLDAPETIDLELSITGIPTTVFGPTKINHFGGVELADGVWDSFMEKLTAAFAELGITQDIESEWEICDDDD